jgi:hypothetical protein
MASLSDIFNPSLLIFLGILVLVAALLVVYFETKYREQNHKINSMFSLVSSLADEVNNLKFSLAHLNSLSTNGGSNYESKPLADETNSSYFFRIPTQTESLTQSQNPNLISVSDDSDSDSDSDSYESEFEEEDLKSVGSTNENELDLNDDNLLENNNDIKVLKLNINNENLNNDDSLDEEEEDLDEIEDLDDQSLSSQNSSSSSEKLLSIQNSIVNDNLEHSPDNLSNTEIEILDISSSDLKTIDINLEESNTGIVDYKKLSLTKLRSIVVEKGLSQDISKLKKNEMLKLLSVE